MKPPQCITSPPVWSMTCDCCRLSKLYDPAHLRYPGNGQNNRKSDICQMGITAAKLISCLTDVRWVLTLQQWLMGHADAKITSPIRQMYEVDCHLFDSRLGQRLGLWTNRQTIFILSTSIYSVDTLGLCEASRDNLYWKRCYNSSIWIEN